MHCESERFQINIKIEEMPNWGCFRLLSFKTRYLITHNCGSENIMEVILQAF